MIDINISNRLRIVSKYLPKEANFCDIGSDHAHLPCFVCLKDENAKAIAGEINEGPYQSALNQVTKLNLQSRIDVRKGNGLAVVSPGEVNQVVIAGMGGTLISTILAEGLDKLDSVERIITQPNINARYVRKWLYKHNYYLVEEQLIEEDGYHYEILVADKNRHQQQKELTEKEYYFGPILLENKSGPFLTKWDLVLQKKIRIVQQMKAAAEPDKDKIAEFEQQIEWLEEVLRKNE
ncbi:tRNA (adenine22-N1)-methyltransferase [Salirhabdus euzebyi]|uniref:tRNA (Adenine22-N1)-methyltransferase n=1 Tax=Salirhabdus euzebyi TaxID=394506 RepID=A0A841Q7A7_9BACI|nr:tRNA (adenine(22)-N(1))-methyltransferase TrmK [Salirhabdus euzebyi]MBB6454300.1 tRNA (adenine22-N1)-methyltransferase [Salirhabdus euzebyi]